jgi:S1-C subfamily serine protease
LRRAAARGMLDALLSREPSMGIFRRCGAAARSLAVVIGPGVARATAVTTAIVAALATLAAPVTPAAAQDSAIEAQSRALSRASDAVVGLRALAIDDARSARTLGRERQGSGVVIGSDGLVLTIGYLVLEAEAVELQPDDGRRIPARVIAYDLASGFGLVQALAPLKLDPVPLGRPADVAPTEPLMIASGGEAGAVSVARLVGRRPFAGYWEYHIEGALFTAPARPDHSGAGLFNGKGELLGIGSLFVNDALGRDGPRVAGNMFVPVDLLTPILGELQARGASRASQRAWLGINCVDEAGEVRIVRVNDDSPADVAGLQAGDHILRIDGVRVGEVGQLWKQLWAGGAPERAVTLEIRRDGLAQTLTVQSVDRAKTLARPRGV